MSRQADTINIRYSDDSQSVETLQQLLKELQELSDQVMDYERRVSSLNLRSRDIIPLKQRGQPVFSELRCRCLCIYKQPPVSWPLFGYRCLYIYKQPPVSWCLFGYRCLGIYSGTPLLRGPQGP